MSQTKIEYGKVDYRAMARKDIATTKLPQTTTLMNEYGYLLATNTIEDKTLETMLSRNFFKSSEGYVIFDKPLSEDNCTESDAINNFVWTLTRNIDLQNLNKMVDKMITCKPDEGENGFMRNPGLAKSLWAYQYTVDPEGAEKHFEHSRVQKELKTSTEVFKVTMLDPIIETFKICKEQADLKRMQRETQEDTQENIENKSNQNQQGLLQALKGLLRGRIGAPKTTPDTQATASSGKEPHENTNAQAQTEKSRAKALENKKPLIHPNKDRPPFPGRRLPTRKPRKRPEHNSTTAETAKSHISSPEVAHEDKPAESRSQSNGATNAGESAVASTREKESHKNTVAQAQTENPGAKASVHTTRLNHPNKDRAQFLGRRPPTRKGREHNSTAAKKMAKSHLSSAEVAQKNNPTESLSQSNGATNAGKSAEASTRKKESHKNTVAQAQTETFRNKESKKETRLTKVTGKTDDLNNTKEKLRKLANEIAKKDWQVRLGGTVIRINDTDKKIPANAAEIYNICKRNFSESSMKNEHEFVDKQITDISNVLSRTQKSHPVMKLLRLLDIFHLFTRSNDTQKFYNQQNQFFSNTSHPNNDGMGSPASSSSCNSLK